MSVGRCRGDGGSGWWRVLVAGVVFVLICDGVTLFLRRLF